MHISIVNLSLWAKKINHRREIERELEMVKAPYYDKNGVKKGAWSLEEDNKLRAYVQRYGYWNWRELPKFAGINLYFL